MSVFFIFILRERRRASSKRLKVNSARDKKHDTKNWNEETDRIIRGAKLATMVPPKKVESEDKPRYKSFGISIITI